MFSTIPVLKAGHPGVPSYMYILCLFVRDMVGWVILLSFLSYFFKLVCYAHVFPCTYTCACTCTSNCMVSHMALCVIIYTCPKCIWPQGFILYT